MSRKDLHMTWDRIEEEWITMTRRIRADWRDGPAGVNAPRREREATPPWPGSPAASGPDERVSERSSLPTLR
jgi:hypothetical protein